MEALIMSCSTGGGHNSAGHAVAEELIRRGHEATFLDPYELVGKNTAEIVGNAYIKLVQKSPAAFGMVYALGEAYRRLPIHSPVYWANGKVAECMRQYLQENHYDVIIMSHIFPAQILANLKEQGVEIPKTVLIATDYTCIPFMEEADCDYYVIPSADLTEEFAARGIPEERILTFGIPVRKEFVETDSEAAKEKLHLAKKTKYILLSGGSIGVGKIEKTVKMLKRFLQENKAYELIIICGNNYKLYQSLTKEYGNSEGIHLLRTTSQMPEYMKACAVFITKPGGLSSTEAATAEIPLIHISPIPGCESHNVKFFEERGMCIYVKNQERELLKALENLQDKEILEHMKQAQRQYVDSRSVDRLCDYIEKKVEISPKCVRMCCKAYG